MEIEKEKRNSSVIESESSDDEISRHLENSQQSSPSLQTSVNIHGTADLPLPFGFVSVLFYIYWFSSNS